MITRTKGGKRSFSWRRGGLLGIPCTVCVGSTNQDESKRPREEKKCWERQLKEPRVDKREEMEARRRGAVSWPLLPTHQPESVVKGLNSEGRLGTT